jgi:formate dehydrogenase assembly factor FdhD
MNNTITGMNPKANCGVLNPPLRCAFGIGVSTIKNIASYGARGKTVELLHKADITLIGYVRGGETNIYSQERRVKI